MKKDKNDIIRALEGGLIVSCQAHRGEPLHNTGAMGYMALAAEQAGAAGIRADIFDLRDICKKTRLPVIGMAKRCCPGSDVIITPTIGDAAEAVRCGAAILAFDASDRLRPGGVTAAQFLAELREKFPDMPLMADCSTFAEGMRAAACGADIVSTTLSGYTPWTQSDSEPDYALIRTLARSAGVPVIAEGRIHRPEQAQRCLSEGAYAVVVGGAITRPQQIAAEYVSALKEKNGV